MKWFEIDQDSLRMKFSALNVDLFIYFILFSSSSPDHYRFKEAGAGGRQRRLPP